METRYMLSFCVHVHNKIMVCTKDRELLIDFANSLLLKVEDIIGLNYAYRKMK